MFRRDFIRAFAAAAGCLIVSPKGTPSPVLTSKSSSPPPGPFLGDPTTELREMLKRCKCIEISQDCAVNDIMRWKTVHRAGDDPRGVSLNKEFDKWLAGAKPTSVNYTSEVRAVDVHMLGNYQAAEPMPIETVVSTIEVEWIGGAI